MSNIKYKIRTFINELKKEHSLYNFIANNNTQNKVFYGGPYWDDEEIISAIETLLVGKWLTSGESVHKFEIEFSRKFYLNDKKSYSLMTNSGSSANLLMLAALKKRFEWNDGDEIIVSVVGFPTTIAPIIQNNLKPVFVDIELDTLNFDTAQISKKITKKTRAIFVSPVLGNPPEMSSILHYCLSNKLQLVLDNCDSLGTRWLGVYLNEYAIASSCSFYPAHHITTAEGGMVSSADGEIIDIARSFAWWGRDCYCVGAANLLPQGTCKNRFARWLSPEYEDVVDHKYVFTNVGYNLKPLDLQGAIGLEQLKKFDEIHKKRKEHKQTIQSLFEKYVNNIRVIDEQKECDVSWFGVPIICDSKQIKASLVSWLEQNNIQTRNYFAGNILLHPAYRQLDDWKKYKNANEVLDRVFFVGCSPQYGTREFELVEDVLKRYER